MPLSKITLVIIQTPCTDHAWLKVALWGFEESSGASSAQLFVHCGPSNGKF